MITRNFIVPARIVPLDETLFFEVSTSPDCLRAYSIPLKQDERVRISFSSYYRNVGDSVPYGEVGVCDVSTVKREGEKFSCESIMGKNDTLERWGSIKEQLQNRWPVRFKRKTRTIGDIGSDVLSWIRFLDPSLQTKEELIFTNTRRPDYYSYVDGAGRVLPIDSFKYPDTTGGSTDSFGALIRSLSDDPKPIKLSTTLPPFCGKDVLVSAYENPTLFKSSWRSLPPPEQKADVLNLELTTGCNYGGCTFCDLYGHREFSQKTAEEFKQHYNEVMKTLKNHAVPIRKIFLGAGNSLGVKQKDLVEILEFLKEEADGIERVSTYGRTKSVLEKTAEELKQLSKAGLGMVYLGAESGSDSVLDYINKGCTSAEIVSASKAIHNAGMKLSMTFMIGVGGMKYSDDHTQRTAELINQTKPEYVTLIGIDPSQKSRYVHQIAKEKDNRPLTEQEKMAQGKRIVEQIIPNNQKVAVALDMGFTKSLGGSVFFNYDFTHETMKQFAVRKYNDYTPDQEYYAKFF